MYVAVPQLNWAIASYGSFEKQHNYVVNNGERTRHNRRKIRRLWWRRNALLLRRNPCENKIKSLREFRFRCFRRRMNGSQDFQPQNKFYVSVSFLLRSVVPRQFDLESRLGGIQSEVQMRVQCAHRVEPGRNALNNLGLPAPQPLVSHSALPQRPHARHKSTSDARALVTSHFPPPPPYSSCHRRHAFRSRSR